MWCDKERGQMTEVYSTFYFIFFNHYLKRGRLMDLIDRKGEKKKENTDVLGFEC